MTRLSAASATSIAVIAGTSCRAGGRAGVDVAAASCSCELVPCFFWAVVPLRCDAASSTSSSASPSPSSSSSRNAFHFEYLQVVCTRVGTRASRAMAQSSARERSSSRGTLHASLNVRLCNGIRGTLCAAVDEFNADLRSKQTT